MGIFQSLIKTAQFFVEDLNTPESFKKGEAFENYMRQYLFPEEKYKLLHRTQGYSQNSRDYVEDSKQPDFTLQCLESKRIFHVEAKYRSGVSNQGTLQYAKPAQFERHKKLNAEKPVFICLGISGEPDSPEYAFLIPISRMKSVILNAEFFEEFEVALDRPISPKKLWTLVTKPATPKFVHASGCCIRCKKPLELNLDKPLCSDCYREWKAFSNPDYTEKYCHSCGKPNKGSILKPLCFTCYKKLS